MTLTERIEFRVSKKMKSDIEIAAIQKKLKVSEYLRYLIRKDIKTIEILRNDRGAE